MDPYEARPEEIPSDDPYINEPAFGRYHQRDSDLQADPKHARSRSEEAKAYWAAVLQLCDQSTLIFDNPWSGRDVFAVGGMIIKSAHRKPKPGVGPTPKGKAKSKGGAKSSNERTLPVQDYSFADRNEVEAVRIARPVLSSIGIRVPQIYFYGDINGHEITIQERIPGVALAVAWRYLSQQQKSSFKEQARKVLHAFETQIPIPREVGVEQYVVSTSTWKAHHNCTEPEAALLFSDDWYGRVNFMHNDLQPSNIIVSDDRIVGIVDWEMAGWFGRLRARDVHKEIRMPKREHLVNASLTKEQLNDMLFWNDLYGDEDGYGNPPTLK